MSDRAVAWPGQVETQSKALDYSELCSANVQQKIIAIVGFKSTLRRYQITCLGAAMIVRSASTASNPTSKRDMILALFCFVTAARQLDRIWSAKRSSPGGKLVRMS